MPAADNGKNTTESTLGGLPVHDVMCAADLFADFVLAGDREPCFGQVERLLENYHIELGGSAPLFASQFAKLGGRVGLVGAVGDDLLGTFLLERMMAINIDVSGVQRLTSQKTGLGVNLVRSDGDRAMLTYLGAVSAVGPEVLSEGLLARCRHWHLAGYYLLPRLRPHWPEWLRRCRAAGLTTSLDTNWDTDEQWDSFSNLLSLVDVFLPNEAEACALAGTDNAEAAGRHLSALGPLVVIKRGKAGAMAFGGGQEWHDAGQEAPVIDTIGAGDTFDAGFLYAWMQKRDVPACLRLAGQCARASLSAQGGVQGQLRAATGTPLQDSIS